MFSKRFLSFIFLFIFLSFTAYGCVRKETPQNQTQAKKIELVYYKLFDEEDVMKPLIQEYQTKHPGVTIRYRKFNDPLEYEKLIVDELAEGEGPDIFSMPNYWFLKNYKKLQPLSPEIFTPEQFDQTFVSVASKDLTLTDPGDKRRKVFALPMTVETLALYYNKSLFEDAIPSRGRPGSTWEQLKDDVTKLSKSDQSTERFQVSGIAMGRSDNIARATDILYLLMLQYNTKFYNDALSKAVFSGQQLITPGGAMIRPATEALNLYTSFGLKTNKNYAWSEYMLLNSKNPSVKEVESFASGKVAMIFGYSYLYEDIKNQIIDLKGKGVPTIDPNNIRISTVPQVYDPTTSTEKRNAYANYYAETVSRTSEHSAEAWDFLMFLTSKQSLQAYNQKTHRPTSRRDLIDEQRRDPIYGPFAEQIGFAESFIIADNEKYKEIFLKAIDDTVRGRSSAEDAIRLAESKINEFLPSSGLLAPVKPVENKNATQQKK